MKTIRKFLMLVLALVLVLPMVVRAEGEEENNAEEKAPVKVYVFRGETCGYCRAALEWFNSIEEEYGKYYDLVTYEVWNNQENAELMEKVANHMGDEADGVPYIIVGKYTYPTGFAADSEIADGKTMGDQLIERIMEEYNKDERFDVMEDLENAPKEKDTTLQTVIIILVVAGLVGGAIYFRKSN